MSVEIKIGKWDATAHVCGVELVRIRRGRHGGWCLVRNGKVASSAITALEMATDGTVRTWLEKEARCVAASELEKVRNRIRWGEDQMASLRLTLDAAEAEAARLREQLARAERVAAALVADVLEGTL